MSGETKPGSGSIRLFCGVPVSMATVRSLAEKAAAMRERAREAGLKVRWTAPPSYHVTLKFLGWSRPEVLTAIRDRVERALEGIAPFELSARGLGAFPEPSRARVLWAGIEDPDGRLAALAGRVERAAVDLGYAAEKRSFHPHVTLARLRAPGDASPVLGEGEEVFGRTAVSEVVLYESVLKSSGSEYLGRVRWRLGGGSHLEIRPRE